MLKLIGAMFICLAVSAVGFLYCEILKKRIRILQAIKCFTSICADKMRFCGCDIFSIFDECHDNELQFLKRINRNNIMNKNYLENLFKEHLLDEKDIKAFVEFIQRLGDSDIEGQQSHCNYYSETFSKLLTEAMMKLNENGKLYRTLFMFGGLALFILII